MLLISSEQKKSQPFKVPLKGQLTLLATGLAANEYVSINIISLTAAGPAGDVCCPGLVSLPEIDWSAPLTCGCDGDVPIQLTHTRPWTIINAPQGFSLQAEVHAADDAVVQVFLEETDSRML